MPDSTPAGPPAGGLAARLLSLDVVRGAVMVLMAIDHVRVYSGLPAGGPTPGIFFTRWITHFVAPAFAFLAGTGAFLHGRKLGDRGALARFLVVRGVWLILLELTVIRIAWTFNFDFAHYLLAGVIWMLGWCMILLAGLIWLPLPVIAAVGLVIVAGHDIVDPFIPSLVPVLRQSSWAWIWQFLYFGGGLKLGATGPTLAILYSIIPWIGVMAAGYAFGPIMLLDAARRRRICFALGGGAIAAFAILRGFDLYGDPRPWSRVTALPAQSGSARAPAGAAGSTASGGAAGRGGGGAPGAAAPAQVAPQARSQATRPPAFLRFLNTNKYPASLLFLLMTLGPMLFALPLLEGARGALASALAVFGRVPFFYYLLHIPLIHAAALVVSALREGSVNPWLFANHPMANPPPPEGYTWNLWLLYAVFVVVVAVLYVPCRWFARLKAARRDRWLSYL